MKRKLQKVIFIVLVLSFVLSLSQSVVASAATFGVTDSVRVRSEPSTDASVVTVVHPGNNVEVLEHDPAGWSRVQVGNSTGFIRSDFLRAPTGSSGTAFRTTSGVNVRSAASTDSNVVATVASGASVEVLEHDPAGWSRVTVNGTSGFIRSDFLTRGGGGGAAAPASSGAAIATLRTTGTVNIRSGASTDTSIVRTLAASTSVEVIENQSNGWSRVRHGGSTGFIRSDLLSATGASSASGAVIDSLRTVTGVNLRSGPSTNNSIIRLLPVNTSVDILENQSNGWSRVRHNGTDGFIRSDLLGTGARTIELIDWATARAIIPNGTNLRVTDVRTGISYNVRVFAKGNHADFDTASQADTDLKRSTRNGTWSWAPRPVWVTIGERTFAASVNGMPHAGSVVPGNGLSGHFCMHFRGSRSNGRTSANYVNNMQNAITEAWNARPNQ